MTTSAEIEIHGRCDSRFDPVRAAFARHFADGLEVGAALAVTIEGEPLVDLWAGHADAARSRPWERDTIVNTFSCTKGMAALCAHMLVDRGALDVEAPVARYWPEFAQAGKEGVLVRHVLSHTAGLPAVREPLPEGALYDWPAMTAALERQEPWWEPGARQGYHQRTYGFLVGEIVRRIDGRSLGAFFREEVAEPLGADYHIGLPEEHEPRVAELVPIPGMKGVTPSRIGDPESFPVLAARNPWLDRDAPNTRAYRAAEIPSSNGAGDARAFARIYGALALGGELAGVRLLSPATIAAAAVEQTRTAEDVVTGTPMRYGLGFGLHIEERGDANGPRSFGHGGAGGSWGYADPDARLGFGYVMNQMGRLRDERRHALTRAVYCSL